jgi:hypothetical protein
MGIDQALFLLIGTIIEGNPPRLLACIGAGLIAASLLFLLILSYLDTKTRQ